MELLRKIEAILFVSGSEGISFKELKKVLEIPAEELKTVIDSYKQKLDNDNSALQLESFGENYKLITREDLNGVLSNLVDNQPNKLSQAALETLSIIAYKCPITRIEIENIRGVDCTFIISKLVALDLIEEEGRAETPGSPILYKVTNHFMDFFKLNDLSQLPDLPSLEKSDADEVNIYKTKFMEEKDNG